MLWLEFVHGINFQHTITGQLAPEHAESSRLYIHVHFMHWLSQGKVSIEAERRTGRIWDNETEKCLSYTLEQRYSTFDSHIEVDYKV